MELLAQARHYTGFRFTFFKVLVPTTVFFIIALLLTIIIPYTAAMFTESHLIILMSVLGTMYFIVAPCAYLLAQKNTAWVLKELLDFIRIEEEIILPILREELSKREEMLARHIHDRRKNLDDAWQKNQKELLAESLLKIQIELDRANDLLVGTTVEKQLKHQEHFIMVHQTIRMLEELKRAMTQKSAAPLSDDEYHELSARLQTSFEDSVQFLTEFVQDQQELIRITQSKIAEAKKLLPE